MKSQIDIDDVTSHEVRYLAEVIISKDEGDIRRTLPKFIQKLLDNRQHLTTAYIEKLTTQLETDRIF